MALKADWEALGAARVTNAPAVGPTMPPAFNLQEFARGSSSKGALILSPDTVLDLVPNVSWADANLDLVEKNVLRYIDGIAPISLLETTLGVSHDELQVMLVMMLARQLVSVVPSATRSGVWSEPASGVFTCAAVADLDEALAQAV
jgi:hypothetical protein